MTAWLSDTILAVSALLAIVLILRKPVARHFGAGVAYCLWILPAARLFMPSLSQHLPRPVIDVEPAIGRVSLEALPLAQTTALAEPGIDWLPLILALWLGGAALLFITQLIRYCSLRDDVLAGAVELKRIGNIRLIETDGIDSPIAFGLLRRFIAVPRDFDRLFAPRERQLALAHELAHHRAGDLFVNLAAFTVLCLLWFNPLAWLAWSAFRFDQEAACDARVLSGADVATRQSYGRALARTATSQLSSFAMALNRPHTIIERLRRLMMQDPSKSRRIAGRLAILAATAIALPLTATIVPVFAEDASKAEEGNAVETKRETRKVISVFSGDRKPTTIDVKGDAETPFVKTIEKDGKTIVLRSNKEMSEAEVEKMVAEAEQSRAEADAAMGEAEAARGEAEAQRGAAEANRANGQHRVIRIKRSNGKTMAWTKDGGPDAGMIPDIDISEIDKGCKGGDIVSTHVNGHDGNKKAAVKMVICGKGNAKLARVHAIEGLKEAQIEMKNDADIPDSVRKSVLDSLQQQIDRMEKQLAEDKDAG